MDWTQAITIMGTSVTGFVFLLTRMDNKFEKLLVRMEANKQDLDHKIESIQKENNTRFNGIENRLTSLEAEVKNTSQRITDLKIDMNQHLSNIENCVMSRKILPFEGKYKEDHEQPKEN